MALPGRLRRRAASRASGRSSRAGEVVYVGDGYSDRCAALAADRVFATSRAGRVPRRRERRSSPSTTSTRCRVPSPQLASRGGAPALPEPYDFELSTARYRAFGPILRTSGTRRGSIASSAGARCGSASRGGVDVEPLDAEIEPVVRSCSAPSSTSTPSTRSPRPSPTLGRARRGASRPPAAARGRAVREHRHLDHRAAGLAPRGVRDPEPADRALRRPGRARLRVPDARAASPLPSRTSSTPSASHAARPSTSSGSHGATSTWPRSALLPDDEVKNSAHGAPRESASGPPTGSSRATSRGPRLARGRPRPAQGGLPLLRRGPRPEHRGARALGERFAPFENLTAHYLLAGLP